MTRVYLYGIASAADNYAVVRSVASVYAIDARGGLANDYRYAIKQHTVESFIVFKDILERQGIKII